MAGTSKMPEFTDDSDLDSDQSFSTALPGSPPVLRRNIGYAQAPAEDEYVVNLDDPELLCTTPTTTRKITARPGQAGDRLDFRGYIVTDYNPTTAGEYATRHLKEIRNNRAHILAAVASVTARDNQGVGVVSYGDRHQNFDQGIHSAIWFPFKQGEDVVLRELAAIRHAFLDGRMKVSSREKGAETGKQAAVKVKTFTVVTTQMEAIRRIENYNGVKGRRQMKIYMKEESLLHDIAADSSLLAERDVFACLYYAPDESSGPLKFAADMANFKKDIDMRIHA